MALKTRVWGAGKILLLTGALAATFLIFALGSMRLPGALLSELEFTL